MNEIIAGEGLRSQILNNNTWTYPNTFDVEALRRQLESINNDRNIVFHTTRSGMEAFDEAIKNNYIIGIDPFKEIKRFLSVEEIEDMENNETIRNL